MKIRIIHIISFPLFIGLLVALVYSSKIKNQLDHNLIHVTSPKVNEQITSPILIQGEARGTWYFEGDFPGLLIDENENIIVQFPVSAQDNWMTEDFVPFKAEVQFEKPKGKTGYLILKKDNPSGLPENEDEIRIPVQF